MKYVYIDIASNTATFALIERDELIAYEEHSKRIGDAELLPCIEKLLASADWTYQDLTNVACIIGPGGFTSLRVAVSCVNTLASQLQIPVAGIHLSTVIHARLPKDASSLWLHSTKRDQLFVCDYSKKYAKPTCVFIDDFCSDAEYLSSFTGWMGELIDDHKTKINLPKAELKEAKDSIVPVVRTAEYAQSIITPWYGRDG